MESAGKRAIFTGKSLAVVNSKKTNKRASLAHNLLAVHEFLFCRQRAGLEVLMKVDSRSDRWKGAAFYGKKNRESAVIIMLSTGRILLKIKSYG